MEFLFEILFGFGGEFGLQVVFELLAEFGIRGLRETASKEPRPWLACIGHVILGAVCGGLSLLVFPKLFLATPLERGLNLGLTPIAAGGAMFALGRWRERREQRLVRLDRFAYGYVFALAMSLMRFWFASQ